MFIFVVAYYIVLPERHSFAYLYGLVEEVVSFLFH